MPRKTPKRTGAELLLLRIFEALLAGRSHPTAAIDRDALDELLDGGLVRVLGRRRARVTLTGAGLERVRQLATG